AAARARPSRPSARPDRGLSGLFIDFAERPRTKSPARAGLKSRRNVGSSEPTGPSLHLRVSELGQRWLMSASVLTAGWARPKLAASSASVGRRGWGRPPGA